MHRSTEVEKIRASIKSTNSCSSTPLTYEFVVEYSVSRGGFRGVTEKVILQEGGGDIWRPVWYWRDVRVTTLLSRVNSITLIQPEWHSPSPLLMRSIYLQGYFAGVHLISSYGRSHKFWVTLSSLVSHDSQQMHAHSTIATTHHSSSIANALHIYFPWRRFQTIRWSW